MNNLIHDQRVFSKLEAKILFLSSIFGKLILNKKTMKTFKHFVFTLIAIICFSSCQMSEEMYIYEDGSGKVSIKMDGNGVMQMMGGSIMKNDDHVKMDTLIVFKDMLAKYKDSIATLPEEERMALKGMEHFTMRMVMDTEEGELDFNMYSDFKSVNELNDIFGLFQKASEMAMENNKKLGGGKSSSALKDRSGPSPNSKVTYFYNKKMFKKSTEIENYEAFRKEIDSSMAMVKGMFASSKYTLKYHFPKPIKSSSVEDAMFSSDRKTIIIERNFVDYMADPKIFDFEVKFEK